MKTLAAFLSLAGLVGFISSTPALAGSVEKQIKQAKDTIDIFKKTDSSLARHFTESKGYAVFPEVSKGGLIVGGARGKGILFENGRATGKTTMSQASIGAQAGGQVYREIIFFETDEVLRRFKDGNLEMSAQVNAVAAGEGASADAKYRDGVLVFTKAIKGLMAEASVGGQKFKYEPIK